MRTLDKDELKKINKELGDEELQVPADAVCLVSDGTISEGIMADCRDDLSESQLFL